jgi:predicted phosphodiesterase
MKIKLLDDLHLEHWRDRHGFISTVSTEDCDVLVLAGDIDAGWLIAETLDRFCEKFPQVVFVNGNHEHYDTPREELYSNLAAAEKRNKNLHWLRDGNYTTTIDGKTFHGATGWFRDDPLNQVYEQNLSDFHTISNLRDWVYEEQKVFQTYLEENLKEGDIVVTHHMPSELVIHDLFKGSVLNRFFVCDHTELIIDRKPSLWLYGHTHMPTDLMIGDTRTVCNPRAYPYEFEYTPFDPNLVIEI